MPESANVVYEGSSSVLQDWEDAGVQLANALKKYSAACKSVAALEPKSNMERQQLAARIDSSLDTLHVKLSSRLSRSRAILAKARNRTLSRFSSLPNEVIRQIFMYAAYTPRLNEKQYPPMAKALETICRRSAKLLSVCSSWRDIALNSSELWSFVPVGNDDQFHVSHRAKSSFRERVQASPLVDRPLHLVVFPWTVPDPYMSANNGPLPRFTSVNIEGSKFHIESLIKDSLHDRSHGTWSELSIHQTQDSHIKQQEDRPHAPLYYMSFGSEQENFTDLISSLTILRVRRAALMWHTFTSSSLNKLVELRLQSLVLSHTSALAEILTLLESAPELQRLKIISVVAFPETPVLADPLPGSFSFPKLQSLLLEDLDFNVLNFLLLSVRPGTHCLTLFLTPKVQRTYQADDYPIEVDMELVYELMESSRVDTLLLQGYSERSPMWLDPTQLHRILKSLPTLTSLKMKHWWLNQEYLLALKRSEDESLSTQPVPFPSLSNLSFILCRLDESDLESVSHVVADHPLQSMQLCPTFRGSELTDPLLHPVAQQFSSTVPHFQRHWNRCEPNMEDFAQDVWQLW